MLLLFYLNLSTAPMPNTPVLLHDHNEFIVRFIPYFLANCVQSETVFLKGISVYCTLMENLGNFDGEIQGGN